MLIVIERTDQVMLDTTQKNNRRDPNSIKWLVSAQSPFRKPAEKSVKIIIGSKRASLKCLTCSYKKVFRNESKCTA